MSGVVVSGPVAVAVGGVGAFNEERPASWRSGDLITWDGAAVEPSGEFGHESETFTDVIEFRDQYIAVGSAGLWGERVAAVWLSPDGMSWTRIPHDQAVFAPTADQWIFAVAASGERLVATGVTGETERRIGIWTSIDGFNWQYLGDQAAAFDGPGSQWPGDIIWDGFRYLIGGSTGSGAETNAAIWRSEDGLSWEPVFDPDLTSEYYASIAELAVVDGGYIAVGQEKTDPAWDSETQDGAVWTSTDGADWVRAQYGDFGGSGRQQFTKTTQTPFGVLIVGTDWVSGDGLVVLWAESATGSWDRLEVGGGAFSEHQTQWVHDIALKGDTIVAVGWDTIGDMPMVWLGTAE